MINYISKFFTAGILFFAHPMMATPDNTCKQLTTIAFFKGDPGLITFAYNKCPDMFTPSLYTKGENPILMNALITAFNKLSLNSKCDLLSDQLKRAFMKAFPQHWQAQLQKYIARFEAIPPAQEKNALEEQNNPDIKALLATYQKHAATWTQEAYTSTSFHYISIRAVEGIILNLITGINLQNREQVAMAFSAYNILYP